MYDYSLQQLARQRTNDLLREAEAARLAKVARADRPDPGVSEHGRRPRALVWLAHLVVPARRRPLHGQA